MKTMFASFLGAVLLLCSSAASAQFPTPNVTFRLWPNGAPTSNGLTGPENDLGLHVNNVTVPTLTVYVPKNPCGICVLDCPGGGYTDVWIGTEGHNLAQWFLDNGIVYAVLKYRLPNGHKEVPLDDVHEAMKILKSHQQEYGFHLLGIQGCSAGGHLAAMTSTHYTKPEERPDFTILYYPLVSFDPDHTHAACRDNLLGKNPSRELADEYSNEKKVTKDTPPALIFHCTDDGLVPVYQSIIYYQALVANGVPASLHVYPSGGHGFCGNTSYVFGDQWRGEVIQWLKGFILKK
ncbi:MAG: alpha/beta hydrolase [Bacteroidaceae bacterium]|nr:alpha/beta hydrolase [Bacteroidaceae bacterium]